MAEPTCAARAIDGMYATCFAAIIEKDWQGSGSMTATTDDLE